MNYDIGPFSEAVCDSRRGPNFVGEAIFELASGILQRFGIDMSDGPFRGPREGLCAASRKQMRLRPVRDRDTARLACESAKRRAD